MNFPGSRRAAPAAALLLLLLAGCATGPRVPTPGADPAPAVAPAPEVAAPTPAVPSAPAVAAQPAAPVPPDAPADAPAPPAVDPLQPERRLDLADRAAQADLWTRVRDGFAMPELQSDRVRAQERWYASRPDYVQRMTERGGRYLFHIVEEVQRRGMPTELALLPFIESAFNPQAMSSAKASGMWQFIPSTGRNFELRQNVFRDDRRDVLASTRAALDYLQKLYNMFGDWHLALAAYNWGEGNVQRAIARNQKAGLPVDYLSLRMPNETADYVPKLQAVKNIVAQPTEFDLSLPALANHPYFVAVAIERDIDVALAARLASMPEDDFKALNPQMNKPVILAAGTPQVLLPYDNANLFVRAVARHRGAMASWTAWVAPTTLRPAEAAKKVGMSEAELRSINRIPTGVRIKAGSVLLVPRSEHKVADVSPHLADNAVISLTSEGPAQRRVALKAGRKDTVASVAKRYRVSAAQVADWNNLTVASSFKPGQSIVVYVAGKHPGAAKVAPAKGRAHATTSTHRKAKSNLKTATR